MHLHCPDCSEQISSDGINIVKTIAICKHCDNLFDFEPMVLETAGLPAIRERREEIIPPGIEVLRLSSELEIMIDWRKNAKTFTFFFAIFWNVFVSVFALIFAIAGAPLVLLFLIPFFLAGGYMLYSSLGYLVNTTYVTVNDHRLSIEHTPIKFLIQRDKHYAPDEIDQVFVRKYSVGSVNNEPVYAYAVDIQIKRSQDKVNIVKELKSLDNAKFIEAEIEYFLNIKDRPVHGEFGRN